MDQNLKDAIGLGVSGLSTTDQNVLEAWTDEARAEARRAQSHAAFQATTGAPYHSAKYRHNYEQAVSKAKEDMQSKPGSNLGAAEHHDNLSRAHSNYANSLNNQGKREEGEKHYAIAKLHDAVSERYRNAAKQTGNYRGEDSSVAGMNKETGQFERYN